MKRFFILCFLFLVCIPTATASETVMTEQKRAYGLYEVADAADLDADIDFEQGLRDLLARTWREFRSIFTRGLRCVVVVLVVSALCGVVKTLFDETPPIYLSIAASLAVMGAAMGDLSTVIGMGQAAIEEMNTFSKVLLPSLMTAGAAAGTPLSATAGYSATVLFSDVLLTVITAVFFPLVYAYLAAATANAALGNGSLGRIADFLKWVVSGSLKLFLMIFVGYLSASGLIAATTDMVGVKTTQFAMSGAVPVVGGILAEASETVVAGAMVVKNSIGIVGLLTILSIVLSPFLTLAVNYFLFKAAAALAEPMCDAKLGTLVDQIGSGVGIVLGMIGASALLLFISIVSGMFMIGIA